MTIAIKKQSYTIPCSSAFRDIVIKLAEDRSVNVADLVRSVLLVVPEDIIKRFPDPGEPEAGDREKTIIKTGPSKGRPWRRKPRLQVRLTPGYEVPFVRRAFNIAVVLDDNLYSIRLQKSETVSNYDLPKLKIDAASALDISIGSPLLSLTRHSYDKNGNKEELRDYMHVLYNPMHFQYKMDLEV